MCWALACPEPLKSGEAEGSSSPITKSNRQEWIWMWSQLGKWKSFDKIKTESWHIDFVEFLENVWTEEEMNDYWQWEHISFPLIHNLGICLWKYATSKQVNLHLNIPSRQSALDQMNSAHIMNLAKSLSTLSPDHEITSESSRFGKQRWRKRTMRHSKRKGKLIH